jgi:sodium/bile acid cotransporter 7
VFFLCVLPSTISSSVAFTAMAGGNVAAAVFNATLSNFVGILVTPLLVSQWLHAAGAGLPIGPAILGVSVQLLLPFILGQLLRPHIHAWLAHHKALVHRIDRGVIVLIVYSSFSDSAAAGLWSGQGWVTVLEALSLCLLAILAGVLSLTRLGPPGAWASRPRTRWWRCSAAPRRVWPAASPWPACCSAPPRSWA